MATFKELSWDLNRKRFSRLQMLSMIKSSFFVGMFVGITIGTLITMVCVLTIKL